MTNRRLLPLATLSLLLSAASPNAMGWGERAHELMTAAAADRAPGPLGQFFRQHRDFLICYSILPDSWWGSPELVPRLPGLLQNPAGDLGHREKARHHFTVDDDVYEEQRGPRGARELDRMDRDAARALFDEYVEIHGEEALRRFRAENHRYEGGLEGLAEAMFEKAGDLPWVIEDRLNDMTEAMRGGDWPRALLLATAISHYAGDAHVPLHAAANYNGQLHPNPLVKGIHGRWEAALVQKYEPLFKQSLGLSPKGSAPRKGPDGLPGDDLRDSLFDRLEEGCALADELIRVDDEILRDLHPGESGRSDEEIAGNNGRFYNGRYYSMLFKGVGEDARRRLVESVEVTTVLWDLAWQRAGRPQPPRGPVDLPPLYYIDFRNDRIIDWDASRHRP